MYLYYNRFWFDANEAEVVLSLDRTYNDQLQFQEETHRWVIKGVRQAASQAALTTSLNTMEAAISQNGGDIGLYLDDQSTLTSHYLISSQCLGGTRITNISYPNGTGAEYSTFRTWSFTLEGTKRITGVSLLLNFNETLEFEGTGGPRIVWLECANGPPVPQTVSQQTTCKARQSGSCEQYNFPPSAPPPMWPDFEKLPDRRIGPGAKSGNARTYTTQWQYAFEGSGPFFGYPNVR